MKVLEAQTDKKGQATLVDVVTQLQEAKQDTYKVTITSQVATLEEGSITANGAKDADEIYVTNPKYGYEIKVDKMLKASITGEKQKEETNKTYTITLNANGGNIQNETIQVAYGEEYGELETPTKIGYNFNGWYTNQEGGTQITSNTKYELQENQTLYAQWTQKEYVSEGLMLRYDGINNTGNGHNGTITTWKDLSGNGNDGIINGAIWEDNCLNFDGIDDWVNCGQRDYSNPTVEVVMSHNKASNSQIVCNLDAGGYSLLKDGTDCNAMAVYIINIGYVHGASNKKISLGKLYSLSGNFNGSEIIFFENGIKYSTNQTGTIGTTKNSTVFALGTNPIGTSSQGEFFNGKIYSIRIYNRALTDEEIRNNYEIDKARFDIE